MKSIIIDNVSKKFGDIHILRNVSMMFFPSKITGLVGPNGAGKTTLFHLITGGLKPDSGRILLDKEDITGHPQWKIARKGVGKLFQDVRIFPALRVIENVVVALQEEKTEHPLWGPLHPFKLKNLKKEYEEKAMKWLEFVGLENVRDKFAGELSFGQQKLLSFARLMAGGFDVLLLDEPTAGVHPEMIKKIENLLLKIKEEQGKTIVIIEHNLSVILDIADYVYFLSEGEVKFSGRPDHVLGEKTVMQEYMGI